MGARSAVTITSSSAATTTATKRLKRENCRHTKYDSAFSPWKLLIASSDWKDHLLGKEGAEKYRTQNLPNCTSCPGVYELGLVVLRHPGVGKFDKNHVIPVYVGQADNVRTRLQQYGRDGAHLENGCSNNELTNCLSDDGHKGLGLFMQIFSKDMAIVYRWIPMKNKSDAERIEAEILSKYDYAWNKSSNGVRRPEDILKKLNCSRAHHQLSVIAQKLQYFLKHVGAIDKPSELFSSENGPSVYKQSNSIISQILKFGRSNPRPVSTFCVSDDCKDICGVSIGHGLICTKPPVDGRKRCAEHKGMKVNGFNPKLVPEGRILSNGHDFPAVCGVILENGHRCLVKPVQGNKRCLQHKGRRISLLPSNSSTKEKDMSMLSPILQLRSKSNEHGQNSSATVQKSQASKIDSDDNCHGHSICGVLLDDGTFCTQQPVSGRRRCSLHKGMRIKRKTS